MKARRRHYVTNDRTWAARQHPQKSNNGAKCLRCRVRRAGQKFSPEAMAQRGAPKPPRLFRVGSERHVLLLWLELISEPLSCFWQRSVFKPFFGSRGRIRPRIEMILKSKVARLDKTHNFHDDHFPIKIILRTVLCMPKAGVNRKAGIHHVGYKGITASASIVF